MKKAKKEAAKEPQKRENSQENIVKELTNEAKYAIIKEKINSGKIKLEVNPEKQARHTYGSKDYVEGRSYTTLSDKEIQKVIAEKSCTGKVFINDEQIKEKIKHDKILGVAIDKTTKQESKTDCAVIHYSKTGTHLVPIKGDK